MSKYRWWIFVAVLLALLLIVPILPDVSNKTLTIMIQIFIVAALATSWNIAGGFAGQINLGHAAFFGLGSLTTRLLWLEGTPFMVAFIAGGVVAGLFALIVGIPALRLRGIYFAIATLALAQALNITVGNVLPNVSAQSPEALVNYELAPRYFLALGVLISTLVVTFYLTLSKLGLGMMTVREDEEAAEAIGVSAFRLKLAAFVLSAFLAGLTGSVFAYFHVSYYLQFAFSPLWTFDAVLVTFIGGIGTIAGPLVGSVFFVLIRDVLATNITNFHLIIFGVLFILVVLLLPGGLVELWQNLIKRSKAMQATRATKAPAEAKGG